MKKTLSLFVLIALAAPMASAAPTVIAGMARNGSNSNAPLPGAKVQLIRPGDKGGQTVVATTTTDGTGRFAFPAREYGNSELLMANIDYQNFDYSAVAFDGGSKLKQVGINVNPQKVDLLVFGSSTQPVPIDFQVHHLAIESTPTGLKCVERIVVHNQSNMTFLGVGPRHISVLLDIPAAAKNVKLDPKITEAKLFKTSDGWGIQRAITPDAYGARNALIFSYDVDWPSSMPWAKNVDLSRKTIYPTKFFFVARTTKDKDLKITAPKLSPDAEAPVPIDGQTQIRLVNSIGAPMMGQGEAPAALPAGEELTVTVARPVNPTFWGFAAMTIALCLFLPLAMVKPRKDKAKSGQGGNFAEPSHSALVSEQTSAYDGVFTALNGFGTDLALTEASRDLIQRIADLDDQREAGKIDESEYQSRRATWKKQLIESLGAPPDH